MTDVWAYLRSLSQEELAARLDQMPLAEQQELLALLEQEKAQDLRAKVQLPPLYPLQQEIKDKAARFNVICIGRRAGKTYLCTHLALETALQGRKVGWFVPDYKVAAEVWREVSKQLKQFATKLNGTERRIELSNGGVVEVWTLENEDAGRGREYHRVIVDEAAMAPRLQEAWENAISPTLTNLKGDAWFPSTPKGLNYYFQLFQQGLDSAKPDWKSWQLPTTVNPYFPPDEFEREREQKPELVFKQEYLAEFITSDGAVFRNVEFVLTARPTLPADHRGHLVVAGVDLAQKHDFTAVSVYCCSCNEEVHLDRWNQLGWEFQRVRLLNLLIKWGVEFCLIELNSIGQPNFEALIDLVPDSITLSGFTTTAQTKPKLIQQASLAIEKGEVSLLPDPTGRFELLAYECEVTATGHPKYGAPEGGYDDTVMARCLAIEAKKLNPLPEPTKAERQNRKLPDALKEQAVVGRLSSLPPAEAYRVLTPRKLALAEIEKREEEERRGRNPYGVFDLL